MLRAIFHEEDFEIHVIGNNTVILYAWNVKREVIWQAAANFESTKIKPGYGFGEKKADAGERALAVLDKWISNEEERE